MDDDGGNNSAKRARRNAGSVSGARVKLASARWTMASHADIAAREDYWVISQLISSAAGRLWI